MTTKPEDALVEPYRELLLLLESAKQWCGIFDIDGQMRHGSSDAPFRAADAITTLLERERRAVEAFALADKLVCDAIRWNGYYVGDGNLEALAEARAALTGMDK